MLCQPVNFQLFCLIHISFLFSCCGCGRGCGFPYLLPFIPFNQPSPGGVVHSRAAAMAATASHDVGQTQVMWPEMMTREITLEVRPNASHQETVAGTLHVTVLALGSRKRMCQCRMCAEASSVSRWLRWMLPSTMCTMCGRRRRRPGWQHGYLCRAQSE